jgi:transposase-like protein
MKDCPTCHDEEHQVKAGRTTAGRQRYRCKACGHQYTPAPKARGYPPELRTRAVGQYVDGGYSWEMRMRFSP